MNISIISHSLDDLSETAQKILQSCGESKLFMFYGDLGAGKTTLIQMLCSTLGYTDEVTSPTFSLINEYSTPEQKIYHMDLYRIKNVEEAFDIGLEEYLYSDAYCFIEWPQVIIEILQETYYEVKISVDNSFNRIIEINKILPIA